MFHLYHVLQHKYHKPSELPIKESLSLLSPSGLNQLPSATTRLKLHSSQFLNQQSSMFFVYSVEQPKTKSLSLCKPVDIPAPSSKLPESISSKPNRELLQAKTIKQLHQPIETPKNSSPLARKSPPTNATPTELTTSVSLTPSLDHRNSRTRAGDHTLPTTTNKTAQADKDST